MLAWPLFIPPIIITVVCIIPTVIICWVVSRYRNKKHFKSPLVSVLTVYLAAICGVVLIMMLPAAAIVFGAALRTVANHY